ncbi:triglyceride lipase PWA37_001117 [Arxiozyma heterogenica]|uniref:AB hydrolase-1 domain-containing protein n=1 Tax=Arxiozyma heterogenica TaxID=278026 RepID=A0AAN7VZA6_9SACH|nr:hypothetical protein RI543_004643 [Kazachstania heterogenica]
MNQKDIIAKNFKVETKIIEAAKNRKLKSVLVPGIDTLYIVYDLYTQILDKSSFNDKYLINFLFLHGSGMNRVIWEYYIARITQIINSNNSSLQWQINKVILLDQVNHGDSAELNRFKLGVDFDWNDGAKDACKVSLKEFQQNEINIVIGHSMGGFQALSCGVFCSEFFNLIITVEPVLVPHIKIKNYKSPTSMHSKFFHSIWSKTKDTFNSEAEYIRFMENDSFYTRVLSDIRDRIIEFEMIPINKKGQIRTKMTQLQNTLCYMTLNPGAAWLIDNLKFITSSVCCILGGVSNWTPKENREVIETSISCIETHIIEDGDHLLNLEIPDIVINKIIERISFHIKENHDQLKLKSNDLSNIQRQTQFTKNYESYCKERIIDYSKSALSKL